MSNLDGTNAGDIAPFAAADAQLNWTGDGQFLIVSVQSNVYGPDSIARYKLVRVSNGERMPLPFAVNGSNGYGETSIRP